MFAPTVRGFVNSKRLLYEMEKAQDLLASTLLQISHEKNSKKILPVYIFSIQGSELLMDDYSQMAA